MTRANQTYLAIVDGHSGYVVDMYPEERARTRRTYSRKPYRCLGEFPDEATANAAVWTAMRALSAKLNKQRRR